MNAKRKIFVVFLALVVFCSFSLINVSASTGTDVISSTTFRPFFAPISVSYSDSSGSVLYDLPFTVNFDISSAESYDTYILQESSYIQSVDEYNYCYLDTKLSTPDMYGFNSALNCSYIYVPFYFELYDEQDTFNGLVMKFNDIFVSSDFDVPITNFTEFFEITSADVHFSTVMLYANVTYFDGSKILTSPVFASGSSFESCFTDLYNRCAQYSYGYYLSDVSVVCSFEQSTETVVISGSFLSFDSSTAVGGAAFANSLAPYLDPVVINEVPTVTESITRGLNSIWNTSLFGTFTIGQVFSACAGFALFGWILKIFNR